MAHSLKQLILTCEHGGAEVPARYRKLFAGKQRVLKTHRGWDIGALAVAKDLQRSLKVPLDHCTVSRLVVDTNRILKSPTLFSEFTSPLPELEKVKILKKYYLPYWSTVNRRAKELIQKQGGVIHVSVHSMTDFLYGKPRAMQLALLYAAHHPREKWFAKIWIQELRKEFPKFKIARNNPYKGDGHSLTYFLRRVFSRRQYVGIEIEMNQALLLSFKTTQEKFEFSQALARSLARAIDRF